MGSGPYRLLGGGGNKSWVRVCNHPNRSALSRPIQREINNKEVVELMKQQAELPPAERKCTGCLVLQQVTGSQLMAGTYHRGVVVKHLQGPDTTCATELVFALTHTCIQGLHSLCRKGDSLPELPAGMTESMTVFAITAVQNHTCTEMFNLSDFKIKSSADGRSLTALQLAGALRRRFDTHGQNWTEKQVRAELSLIDPGEACAHGYMHGVVHMLTCLRMSESCQVLLQRYQATSCDILGVRPN